MKRKDFTREHAQLLGLMVLVVLWTVGLRWINTNLVHTYEISGEVYKCYTARNSAQIFWGGLCFLSALTLLIAPMLRKGRTRPSERLEALHLNATTLARPRPSVETSNDWNPYSPPAST